MRTFVARVANGHGIHCRPSAIIIKELSAASAEVILECADGRRSRADSILAVIGMGLRCGEQVAVHVSGPDEEAVGRRVVELLETHFDFPTGDA